MQNFGLFLAVCQLSCHQILYQGLPTCRTASDEWLGVGLKMRLFHH